MTDAVWGYSVMGHRQLLPWAGIVLFLHNMLLACLECSLGPSHQEFSLVTAGRRGHLGAPGGSISGGWGGGGEDRKAVGLSAGACLPWRAHKSRCVGTSQGSRPELMAMSPARGQRLIVTPAASVSLQWKIFCPCVFPHIASGLRSLLFHFHLKS